MTAKILKSKKNGIIKPNALRPGDTLGVVATSTPINASSEETIERAYSRLRDFGFKLVEAPNCRTVHGHTAGTIKDRVKALHDFYRNPKIDGIISYWGGFQTHQLLEYIDFDLIKKNPKPFIGFSDVTAFQIALYKKIKMVSFSGPAGITFGKPTVPELTTEHFKRILMTPGPSGPIPKASEYSDNPWYLEPDKKMIFQPNPGWKVYRHGKAEGVVIGGNTGTMLLLAGTEYWPDMRGKILFVEDDEAESSKTLDRMFTQLRQLGVYDLISGMVIGRFQRNVAFKETDSLEMILDGALKGYKFPVITGVDFGHTDPLITIPLGIEASMNTRKVEIRILEPAVKF